LYAAAILVKHLWPHTVGCQQVYVRHHVFCVHSTHCCQSVNSAECQLDTDSAISLIMLLRTSHIWILIPWRWNADDHDVNDLQTQNCKPFQGALWSSFIQDVDVMAKRLNRGLADGRCWAQQGPAHQAVPMRSLQSDLLLLNSVGLQLVGRLWLYVSLWYCSGCTGRSLCRWCWRDSRCDV